jgi:hypothetical protein
MISAPLLAMLILDKSLNSVAEEGCVVTLVGLKLHLSKGVLARRLVHRISPCVLSAEVRSHDCCNDNRQRAQRDQDAVTHSELRSIASLENKSGHCASNISLARC